MKIKTADYIAQWCVEKGIKHVFTVTGGGAMHLNDALGNHPGLKCVYTHHEQAAAIAAEGYYKASGIMPLVCVTTGPGGTNALTGVLGAWLDSVPMLVISGQVKFEATIKSVPEIGLRQLGDQEFNITDTVKTMTKYSVMVTDPITIGYHLEKALFIAKNGRPGPVWVDIPLDVQAAPVETGALAAYDRAEDSSQVPAELTRERLDEIIKKLDAAKRPAIIAGAGVRLSGAFNKFNEFVRLSNIPVMTAWNSNDLVEDSNPLYAGRPGTVGTRGGNFVFQNADLLLVIGCRMNLRQIGYAKGQIAPGAYKIMIDIDEAELKKQTFPVDMPVLCDCGDFLSKMIASGYRKASPGHDRWLSWCGAINKKYPVINEAVRHENALNPYIFLDKLYRRLPEGQVTVTANGSACVISFQTAVIKKGQRLFTNSGCASMGYGLPASIGACAAGDGRQVICVEGDGSIMMNIQELQTLSYNRFPVKVFIINNGGYLSIRQTQENFFNKRFAGIGRESGLGFPDFSLIAAANSMKYIKISSETAMEAEIEAALGEKGPVLCEVVVDGRQNFAPKSSSKILPDGKMQSAPLHDMYPFLPEKEMEENKFR